MGFLDFIRWYSASALNAQDLLNFFFKQLVVYILMQVVISILPFLKSVMNVLWFPFRWMHIYMHMRVAKEHAMEINEQYEEDKDELDRVMDSYALRSSLVSGFGRWNGERSMLILSFNRLDRARSVALAPNRIGMVLVIGYFIVSPLAFFSQALFTDAGALIHLYFFIGIFAVLMPEINDYYFILNTLLLNAEIRNIYFYNSIVVYVIFTFDTFWRTNNFFFAVFVGTMMFIVYIAGLFVVSWLAQGGKIKTPKIYYVPIRDQKEWKNAAGNAEFDMSDMDLDFDID